ncbi:MAG: hypothetical protein ACFFAI_09985 [Promethearchaeota archaeon]
MFIYISKVGKWEDFFGFDLPDLIFLREESDTLEHSMEYSPDKELKLPASILEIGIYNPMAYENQKVLKAKLWIDVDGMINQSDPQDYLKYSEYSFELKEILYKIGAEIKLTVLRDKTSFIQIKKPSLYTFERIFKIFKNRIKERIPFIENWLIEHLKQERVVFNEYITLELKGRLFHVYCKGKHFWTFIKDDIRRSPPEKVSMNYQEWFNNIYLAHAEEKFVPQKLEFLEVCELFQQWNDNNLKNLGFNWHFYDHLMGKLHDVGHPEAKTIFENEFKRRNEEKTKNSKERGKRRVTQKGDWEELFDYEFPEQKFKALESRISSGIQMEFTYNAEKMIPRSILDISFYDEIVPNEGIVIKWYLERNYEMREIEYERNTYFKYWEFISKKEEILRYLGEEIYLFLNHKGFTAISFNNPNFIPIEISFSGFKDKLKEVFYN